MFEDTHREHLRDTYALLARITLPNLRVLAIRHLCDLNHNAPPFERDARFDIPLDAFPILCECYFNHYKCTRTWLTMPSRKRPPTMAVFQTGHGMNPDKVWPLIGGSLSPGRPNVVSELTEYVRNLPVCNEMIFHHDFDSRTAIPVFWRMCFDKSFYGHGVCCVSSSMNFWGTSLKPCMSIIGHGLPPSSKICLG